MEKRLMNLNDALKYLNSLDASGSSETKSDLNMSHYGLTKALNQPLTDQFRDAADNVFTNEEAAL